MSKREIYFNPVDLKVDFPKMEREELGYWYKSGVVKKYLTKNKFSKKRFSFLDGPITANNPMGVHHAWGRTYKDLWQRFYNMQGYRQRFQNGFDCQGLWVEVEVEKELGLKSKRDIENLVPGDSKKSIAKFVELCKKRVFKFADVQTKQSKRLGYFMDWDNSYFTLSDENNFMIWHFLKKCHEKGLIYKGRDSVPWCPRCGTAISQHEILTEDYKDITHDAVYVAYPLIGKNNEFLLIWTTTPWTLPANVAVAVDPKLDYVLAKDKKSGKLFYLLADVARKSEFEVSKKLKGAELVGLLYTSPFDNLHRVRHSLGKYKHRVVKSDDRILPITTQEGTGLIHIATGAGSEDFALGKKEKLPVIEIIDEEAAYLSDLGELTGKNAKKRPELIIDFLKSSSALTKTQKYEHRYPVCWRCKTELVWRVVDEWYISMDKSIPSSKPKTQNSKQNSLRYQMIRVAKKIRWLPEFGLERELDWLNNMHDWLISKKRYWGLAIPIWECGECGHFEVIGSNEELKDRSVAGWEKFEGNSPHRPWVDEVKIKCSKCGAITSRIPDVGNPWLDAGIVPYSTITKDNKGKPMYLTNKEDWKKWFPVDFITESFPGQFKNWFYAMIAESTVLENKEPYKTVLGFATLLGEDGEAMHKSLGNAIEFNEGADKIGVDVMRWMYVRQDPQQNLLFGYHKADEVRRRFHLKIWNSYNFFVTYANVDGFKPSGNKNLKLKTNNVLDKWIISRLNQTTGSVTSNLTKYNAYRASEEIERLVDDFSNWFIRRSRNRVGPTSENSENKTDFYNTSYRVLVTLTKLLSVFTPFIADVIYKNLTKDLSVHLSEWPSAKGFVNKKLVSQMKVVREVVELAHAQRKESNIPVRQPLNSLSVMSENPIAEIALVELIGDEINVKTVNWEKGEKLQVTLDLKITKELADEGKARELVRTIQSERRKMGIALTQKVEVSSPWIPESAGLARWVKEKTLAVKLKKGNFNVVKKP